MSLSKLTLSVNDTKSNILIEVDARWINSLLYLCLSIEVFVALADIFLSYLSWLPWETLQMLFNITREDAIGNWFSSVQTLFVGIVLWLHYRLASALGGSRCWPWALMSGFFVFMAIDDATSIHERLGVILKATFDDSVIEPLLVWFPSYAWQLFLAPVFALLGLLMAAFLWRELSTKRRFWAMLAFSLLGLAVAIDFVEGLFLAELSSYFVSHALKLIEEMLEMLATTVLLVVFLQELAGRVRLYVGVRS